MGQGLKFRVSTLTLASAGKAPHGSISADTTADADSHRVP